MATKWCTKLEVAKRRCPIRIIGPFWSQNLTVDLRRIYQFIWHPGIWQHDSNNYIVTTNAQNNYILFEFYPSITNESWTDMHAELTLSLLARLGWRRRGQCCWTLSWRCKFCSPFIHTHSPVLELLLLYFSKKKKKKEDSQWGPCWHIRILILAIETVSTIWSITFILINIIGNQNS